MKRLPTALFASISLTCLALPAFAQQGQPQQPPPPQPGEGRPERPGGVRGPGNFDPAQFVDRLMANDTDGDGKLSESEFPENLRERMFTAADANGDKLVDRDELTKYMQERRPGGPEGGFGGQGQQISFHQAMENAGNGLRGLRNSAFDNASQERDLQAVQRIQSGLIAAKGQYATVPMSAAAQAKFGMAEALYRKELRRHLVKAIAESMTLEMAILDGDAAGAKASFARLHDAEEAGHDLFQGEE